LSVDRTQLAGFIHAYLLSQPTALRTTRRSLFTDLECLWGITPIVGFLFRLTSNI